MHSSCGRRPSILKKRVLKRVEIEDARLDNEITQLLMGSEVMPRRNFIYEHAAQAVIDA